MKQKIIIIGGVALGPKAASRAKRLNTNLDITLIDQDSIISYGGCGIPYFVSGDVPEPEGLRQTSFHMLRDEKYFKNEKGFSVKTRTRAVKIDRENKMVLVENLNTEKHEQLKYDKLVLGTGSIPFIPPVPGVNLENVYTINNLHKAVEVKGKMSKGLVGKAVVVGGGAIGLEMAEAMADLWGIETTIIEMAGQLLPNIIDSNMAVMARKHLEEKGVTVLTGEQISSIEADENGVANRVITRNQTLETDLVILATGIRPNTKLAVEAGLQVGIFGGLLVNQRLQTSDPDIYAGGDCVEMLDLVSGLNTFAPLGSLANRQGRVIGSNLAGTPETFPGATGSFIIKLFDICVAKTGLTLEVARRHGYDAFNALVVQMDKAHFYPEGELMYMQMTVDKKTRRVLGVQGVGPNNSGLLARISAAAALLPQKPVVSDFSNLEMPYSPPYASAMDIINTLANCAENILDGFNNPVEQEKFIEIFNNRESGNVIFLDVRSRTQSAPLAEKYGPHWQAIPQDEMRSKIAEIPDDKEIILICNAGGRSFEAQVTLAAAGKINTFNLQGGLGGLKKAGVIL
jgi:NADPH-dependent 2,4-dienoyl-CoA reductase/sulfur reductase-like enzyme/rhodanese-related sulfurtransferase